MPLTGAEWNLLHYDTPAQWGTDFASNTSLTKGGRAAAVAETGVTVIQNKNPSPGFWVMMTTFGTERFVSPNLALQVNVSLLAQRDVHCVDFASPKFIIDPNGIQVVGFFSGLPKNSIVNAPSWVLMQGQTAPPLTNQVDDVWYLLSYPTDPPFFQNDPAVFSVLGEGVATLISVTVYPSLQGNSATAEDGVWILLRVATAIAQSGKPYFNAGLTTDGFLRLIYDFTSNTLWYSLFQNTDSLSIVDISGALILAGLPISGFVNRINTPPPPGAGNVPSSNLYRANAVTFNGATGLISGPNFTKNTATVSFSGWFQISAIKTGVKLDFSQGSGSDGIVIAEDGALLPLDEWFHLMGVIRGDNQTNQLLLNRIPVGTTTINGSAFGLVRTDGQQVTLGTDGTGDFFVGDVADLSIFFDLDFAQSGSSIPNSIINVFNDHGKPVSPIYSFAQLSVQPDIYLGGLATFVGSDPVAVTVSQTFINIAQTIPLKYTSGKLTDTNSSPSDPTA